MGRASARQQGGSCVQENSPKLPLPRCGLLGMLKGWPWGARHVPGILGVC